MRIVLDTNVFLVSVLPRHKYLVPKVATLTIDEFEKLLVERRSIDTNRK